MKLVAIAVLVLAACGDDGDNNQLPDAPLFSDGPADSAPGTVTLTVTVGGAPAQDVAVYFQAQDSSLVAMKRTDAAGKATAESPAGSFVTVIEPQPPAGGGIVISDRLTTFAAVQPGDDLHLDLVTRGVGSDITFDVIAPNDPTATTYTMFTTCGDPDITPIIPLKPTRASGRVHIGRPLARAIAVPNEPVQVTLTDCNGTADIAVVTSDSGVLLQSFYLPDVAVASAQTTMLDGTYAPIGSTSVMVMNVPAAIATLGVGQDLATARGSIYNGFAQIDAVAGSAIGSLAVPGTTNTTSVMNVVGFPSGSAISQQSIIDWEPTDGAFTVDWTAMSLPEYTVAPTFDPANHTLVWSESSGAALAPDLVRASYHTFRPGGSPEHAWDWRIVAPHGTSTRYPTLPAHDGFDFNTVATDSIGVNELTTAKVPGGYAAARARAFAAFANAGPSGRIVHVDLMQQPGAR